MNSKELLFEYTGSRQKQKDFLRFHIFVKGGAFYKVGAVLLLLTAVIIYRFFRRDFLFAVAGIVLAIFVIGFFTAFIITAYRKNLRSVYKNFPTLFIKLGEKDIIVTNKETNETLQQNLEQIIKAYLYRNYLFLYLDRNQALCLHDGELIAGNLINYLNNNPIMQNKYRSYRRSKK